MFNILHVFMQEESGLEKKRVRLRPFRILSVFLGIAAVASLAQFPDKAVSVEHKREELMTAATAYYDAQSRNNELMAELAESNSDGFIERTARSEYVKGLKRFWRWWKKNMA